MANVLLPSRLSILITLFLMACWSTVEVCVQQIYDAFLIIAFGRGQGEVRPPWTPPPYQNAGFPVKGMYIVLIPHISRNDHT